jgi:hypothetical protein
VLRSKHSNIQTTSNTRAVRLDLKAKASFRKHNVNQKIDAPVRVRREGASHALVPQQALRPRRLSRFANWISRAFRVLYGFSAVFSRAPAAAKKRITFR